VKVMFRILVAAAFMLAAMRAEAQTIPGLVLILPTSVMDFQPSADHDAVKLDGSPVLSNYRVDFYLLDASGNIPAAAPVAFSLNVGKPDPVSGVIVVPNAFGSLLGDTAYRVRVVAIGPGGAGASPTSVPFGKTAPAKVPAAPPAPRIGQ
jgi:hypothetical protein